MEVSVPCHKPASLGLSRSSGSVTTPNIPTHYSSGSLSMNDLKMCLNEFLSVEDIGVSTGSSPVANISKCGVMEDECKELDESIDNLPDSTTSVEEELFGREDYKTSEVNDCNKSADQSYSPPKSSLTPFKLASAMKGGREKKGIWPEKLSVTWASDVYDPIPTSVSHFPSSKNQEYGRRYGKNRRRGGGKSSRGGKGKDKKQVRKNGCNATKPKAEHDDGVASFSEPEAGGGTISFSDPFCGSSFLKESANNLHFPVEATG